MAVPRWQSPDEGVGRAEKLSRRAFAVLRLIIELEGRSECSVWTVLLPGQFGQLRGGGELTIKPDLGRLQQ
jgi:hypothetical protein